MKKTVCALLTLTLLFMLLPAGCVSQKTGTEVKSETELKIESPYTFDYTTDKSNAAFFTNGDTFNTLKAAGPLYSGARALPTKPGAKFQKLRDKKVSQITGEAELLVRKTQAVKPKVAKIRRAYLRFLTQAYKEEPKLKEYTKETFSRISALYTKEGLAAAEYDALRGGTKNRFADAFMGYLKVGKSVELAGVYLEDINNIVGFSAAAVSTLSAHPNPKVKAAVARLDREMAAFDKMHDDIKSIQESVAKIDYGQRQLESADYYLAKEGERFMAANIASLTANADKLKPRPGLTKEDIAFIKDYVKVMGKMRRRLETRLDAVDTSRIVPVKVKKRQALSLELVSPAYAADELPFVSGAADALGGDLKSPPSDGISGWDILKLPGKVLGGVKKGAGVLLDTAGVAVQNITRAGFGVYHGEPAKDIWDDMKKNTRQITDNFKNNVSGASTFDTAGQYLEGLEKGAGGVAEKGAEEIMGKGWTSWGVGGFTQIVVGTFTGLGKGIFKISKTNATSADLVSGSVDIGLSFIGGSKTIFNPAVLKTLGKEGLLSAKGGVNFLRTMMVNADKASLKKAMAELLANPKLTRAEVMRLLRASAELEAKEAVSKALAASRERLLKAMKNMLKAGGKKALVDGEKALKESLEGLLEKTYTASIASIRELIGDTVGKDTGGFLANVVAGKVDGFISGLITELLAGSPDPEELNGAWAGSMTITDVIVPEAARAEAESEGCDLNFDELKGKSQPLNWTMQLGEGGGGTLTGDGGGGAQALSVNYDGGVLTGSGSQEGASLSMQGNFVRGETSGYSGSGSMTINSEGGLKIIAKWTVSK